MSTKFEGISNLWLENESYSKNYTYSKELRSSVKHLNRYFGNKVAKSIKGLDVELYIRCCYETKNPNNNKPYSKRLLNDIISTGYRIFEFALDNELIDNIRNPFASKKKKIPKDAPITQRLPINNTQKQYSLLFLIRGKYC